MRCLYCGKELALLKRWTGGGEFCSDAHRQQYQDEYNQLALTRLLQAKPPAESAPAAPEAKAPAPLETPSLGKAAAAGAAIPEPQPVRAPVAAAAPPVDTRPVKRPVNKEDQAPAALLSFLVEIPVPAMVSGIDAVVPELDFEVTATPALPQGVFEELETQLRPAGRLLYEPHGQVHDYSAHGKERKLESREFVRGTPLVDFDLGAAGEVGLLETSEKSMDILILPQSPAQFPGGSPPLWTAPEQGFTFDAQLGALARAVFRTTGFGDAPEDTSPLAPAVETVPAFEPIPPESTPAAESAVVIEPVAFQAEAPVKMPAAKVEVEQPPVAVPVEAPPVTVSKRAEPVPLLVTKPLPLTLHGLAAGRGKAVQIFPSAVSTGVDIQVPRSSGLPLRPVMILSSTPATPAKPEEKLTLPLKPELKKQDRRPDPRFANGKNRKPALEPERKEPEKKAAAAVSPAVLDEPAEAAPIAASIPEPQEPVEKKSEPKTFEIRQAPFEESNKSRTALPAPLSAPYTPPDLGLPSLNLQADGSFFSKLPVAGKLGAMALALVVLGGGLYFMTKGGGTSANTGPHWTDAGPALPAGDSGWITDWGAETGVKRQHEISVLRPSMNLTDYRIEFQAQIESKALGWVYRAKDPKNYYATRIEIVKPGLEPTVALVRFAVINGEEQPHAQFPLSLAVRIDTLYRIRFEAAGDRFTTWVQDQKVDEWTDDRIKTGGVGLYNLWGERMSLKGSVNVIPLVMKR